MPTPPMLAYTIQSWSQNTSRPGEGPSVIVGGGRDSTTMRPDKPQTDSYVRKPCQGREGANVLYMLHGQAVQQTDGPYGDQPCVYQAVQKLPAFGGNYAVIGSWLVDHEPCGLSIREDAGPITGNNSRFLPHAIV